MTGRLGGGGYAGPPLPTQREGTGIFYTTAPSKGDNCKEDSVSTKPPKLTPWFPGDVKPARKGIYQRLYPYDKVQHCYWTGRSWRAGTWHAGNSMVVKFASDHQRLSWRGLASKPIPTP